MFCRNLQLMKLRLKGAQKGHSLLKKKADALTMRFRMILKKIIDVSHRILHYTYKNCEVCYFVCIRTQNLFI